MATILFFAKTSLESFELTEYYSQDIIALQNIGHKVIVTNKIQDALFKSYDVIFIWWWTYALLPIVFSILRQKKSIITGTFNFRFTHSGIGQDYVSRPLWERSIIYLAAKLADYNLFVNQKEYRFCRKILKIKNSRHFPHIILPEYVSESGALEKNLLFNLSWSGKKNIYRKGILDIIDAVKIVLDSGLMINMVLAGEKGDGFSIIEDKIKSLKLEESVVLAGEISKEEKLKLLKKCALYLQPSFYEGFGVAIGEAMASRCCIITCRVGGVPYLAGDTVRYVSPGDVSGLASAIIELLNCPPLRADLGARAQGRILEHFGLERKVYELSGVLKELNV